MKTLWALHGFLGLPSDWNFLREACAKQGVSLQAINLYDTIDDFSIWSQKFCEKVQACEGDHFLLGYSLGGRLALHALLQDQAIWKKAIIVSAHPGLNCEKEKSKRRLSDQNWAEKFMQSDWEELLKGWNSQAVLAGDQYFLRVENDYSRESLAEMMNTWSLSRQSDLSPRMKEIKVPTLWVTGSDDTKFSFFGARISGESENVDHLILPGGHRVPWDCEEQFVKKCMGFFI